MPQINKPIAAADYEDFKVFLEQACGILLGDNKHYLVSSRLNRLMSEFAIPNLGELVKRLKGMQNIALQHRVVDAMTTNETLWFRDTSPFELLKQVVLPEISQQRGRPLRIWSAACSSGQEPYSISIAIQEYLQTKPGSLPKGVQIVATDISPSMLKEVEEAVYDKASLARGISADRRQRFFSPKGDKWAVRPEVKSSVTIKELNLLNSYSVLGKFDVIFCRNVLIYFSTALKTDILMRLASAMHPQGYLFLGASESIANYSDAFEMVRHPSGVMYRLKKTAR
jgi:chemotaxis protein methyltransferase CheR